MELAAIDVLQTRADALAEGRQRWLGDRIWGREPVTPVHRQGLAARDADPTAARRAGRSHPAGRREAPVGAERRTPATALESRADHGRPLDPADGVTILSRTATDAGFNPGPVVRRRRAPPPPSARGDPMGRGNMLAALKARGLRARLGPAWRSATSARLDSGGYAHQGPGAVRRDGRTRDRSGADSMAAHLGRQLQQVRTAGDTAPRLGPSTTPPWSRFYAARAAACRASSPRLNGRNQITWTEPAPPMLARRRSRVTRATARITNTEPFAIDSQ